MPTGQLSMSAQLAILAVVLLALYGFAQLVYGPTEEQLRTQYFQWFREAYSCTDKGKLIICRYP